MTGDAMEPDTSVGREELYRRLTEAREAYADLTMRSERMKAHARIRDLENELAEARAQIAAKEQEHQDFRLQNDREWRAKLDHLKAQIAAWEQAAGIYFMIDAGKAYQHLLAMNEGKRPRHAI